MISQETIDKIIDRADIVDIIGEFVNLHRAGSNYKGLCPFHNEKTPSFVVSPQKQIFKCFGCGASGNAVSFIMQHEQVSFVEAIKWIANKYGIQIEEKELSPEEIQKQKEKESIEVLHIFAQKHFSKNLFETTEGQNIALPYFEMRGFSRQTIEKFQLGYALNNKKDFIDTALEKGYTLELLEKSGLVGKRENKNPFTNKDTYYDRFRGRVIFPIHSLSGKVIAFGGRILNNDKKMAKYINSPETILYNKSRTLYGLYFAKREIVKQDKCYLVEGYTDVISMHQAGITNTVASAGTSLTEEQIHIIHRFTENLTLLFDGDQAGLKAGLRGLNLVLKENMNVKIVVLPDGEDPDSFTKNNPISEVKEYLEKNQKDFIFFKIDLLNKIELIDPIKKSKAIKNILESISVIPDEIKRSAYIKECSRLLETDEKILVNEINKILKVNYKKEHKAQSKKQEPETEPKQQTDSINLLSGQTALPEERELTELLLNFGDKVMEVKDENDNQFSIKVAEFIIRQIDSEGGFKTKAYQKIFELAKEMFETSKTIDKKILLNSPDDEVREIVEKIHSKDYTISKFWENNGAMIITPEDTYQMAVERAVIAYKIRLVDLHIKKLNNELKNQDLDKEEIEKKFEYLKNALEIRSQLYDMLGNRNKYQL